MYYTSIHFTYPRSHLVYRPCHLTVCGLSISEVDKLGDNIYIEEDDAAYRHRATLCTICQDKSQWFQLYLLDKVEL